MMLVITACLIGAPADCRDDSVTLAAEELPPMACLATAQSMAADWQSTHPKWRVVKTRCQPITAGKA